MSRLLPPATRVELRARSATLDERALAAADAAVIWLDAAAAAAGLARLPQAALWRSLYRAQRRGASTAPILSARLANRRHTLVVIGFLEAKASAFQRLQLAGKLLREALKPGVRTLQLHVKDLPPAERSAAQEALASAALAAAAAMPSSRTRREPASELAMVEIAGRGTLDLPGISAVSAGNHLARWLAMLPPNQLDALAYRRVLERLAAREGWRFRFYGERELKRLGAGAFLAVSRANAHRGAGIIRLSHRPRGTTRRIALVGKGICFDTGGINLKAHRGMYDMHGDMQGSAVAVGTLLALTRRALPVAADCWLAITENQIGPLAYRPQEIVRAVNGVTIQVVHSDAEGRMVLADTLALAARERPSFVIDFATLTGACVNALTERYSGVFTNRPALQIPLQEIGRVSGERVWCFPMDEDFDTDLESPVADVMQCALDGKGDHILAARFLARFVPDALPWVHVDLSASEHKGGLAHVPTDFTGFGVRFAVRLLEDRAFTAALDGR